MVRARLSTPATRLPGCGSRSDHDIASAAHAVHLTMSQSKSQKSGISRLLTRFDTRELITGYPQKHEDRRDARDEYPAVGLSRSPVHARTGRATSAAKRRPATAGRPARGPRALRGLVEDRAAAPLGRPGHRPRLPRADAERPVPTNLPGAATGPDFDTLPFTSLYQPENEFAAEMANRTVHAVMHLSWVPDESGGYRGQLAVLVKPNGLFGTVYMAAIKPIRSMIVYPALMRRKERKWQALAGDPASAQPSDREPSNGNEAMATAETIAVPAGVAELTALGTVDYQEAWERLQTQQRRRTRRRLRARARAISPSPWDTGRRPRVDW